GAAGLTARRRATADAAPGSDGTTSPPSSGGGSSSKSTSVRKSLTDANRQLLLLAAHRVSLTAADSTDLPIAGNGNGNGNDFVFNSRKSTANESRIRRNSMQLPQSAVSGGSGGTTPIMGARRYSVTVQESQVVELGYLDMPSIHRLSSTKQASPRLIAQQSILLNTGGTPYISKSNTVTAAPSRTRSSRTEKMKKKSDKKLHVKAALVILGFIVCWTPATVVRVLSIQENYDAPAWLLFFMGSGLAVSGIWNACVFFVVWFG
ncbi:hypothetical protein HK100_006387, partial [Physocladia obscura]